MAIAAYNARGASTVLADANYYPVADGASWTYSIRIEMSNGETFDGEVRQVIKGTMTVDGKAYLKLYLTSSGIPGAKSSGTLLRVGPEGVYRRGEGPEWLLLPARIASGQKWTVKTADGV